MNRRMPNGTYGGVRGRGCEAPAYSILFLGFEPVSDFHNHYIFFIDYFLRNIIIYKYSLSLILFFGG